MYKGTEGGEGQGIGSGKVRNLFSKYYPNKNPGLDRAGGVGARHSCDPKQTRNKLTNGCPLTRHGKNYAITRATWIRFGPCEFIWADGNALSLPPFYSVSFPSFVRIKSIYWKTNFITFYAEESPSPSQPQPQSRPHAYWTRPVERAHNIISRRDLLILCPSTWAEPTKAKGNPYCLQAASSCPQDTPSPNWFV